jgi:hypothetical protein
MWDAPKFLLKVERVVPWHAVVMRRRLNALAKSPAALPPDICTSAIVLPSVRAGLAFSAQADPPSARTGGTVAAATPQRVGNGLQP